MTNQISFDMPQSKSQASLTIAIPTFDRPHELRRCVLLLKNQTNYNFHLLIIDNASPVAASEALQGLLEDFPALSVRIARNSVNIGGDANVLRCFELCETDYVWVLGDDDAPLPDAIETVLSKLAEYPDALFLNFATEPEMRQHNIESRSLDAFVAAIDFFPNILFASTSVFSRRELVRHLGYGYHRIYAMAPHLSLLFRSLMDSSGRCVLLSSRIVQWSPPQDGKRWSFVGQMMGAGILLDVQLSTAARRILARHLVRPRAIEYATAQIAAYRLRTADAPGSQYLMDQMYGRLLRYSGGWVMWIRYFLCRRILLTFPRATIALFRRAVGLTGRGAEMLDYRNPFQ